MNLSDDQCTILILRGQVMDLEGERDRALARVKELEERIALAGELADNCSGVYMRMILSGEIDRAEHESRRL